MRVYREILIYIEYANQTVSIASYFNDDDVTLYLFIHVQCIQTFIRWATLVNNVL